MDNTIKWLRITDDKDLNHIRNCSLATKIVDAGKQDNSNKNNKADKDKC